MIEVVRERRVAAPPAEVWDGVAQRQRQHGRWGRRSAEVDREITEYDPPRRYGWRHLAERLDGKPAPVFARSTKFEISLAPPGGGTLVRLRSAQEPASALKGLVMRAFGTRDVAASMDRSLDRLAALFPDSP